MLRCVCPFQEIAETVRVISLGVTLSCPASSSYLGRLLPAHAPTPASYISLEISLAEGADIAQSPYFTLTYCTFKSRPIGYGPVYRLMLAAGLFERGIWNQGITSDLPLAIIKPPLHTALESGHLEWVEDIAVSGADLNEEFDGETPIVTAMKRGLHKIARILLKHGAYPSDEDCNQLCAKDRKRLRKFVFGVQKQVPSLQQLCKRKVRSALIAANPGSNIFHTVPQLDNELTGVMQNFVLNGVVLSGPSQAILKDWLHSSKRDHNLEDIIAAGFRDAYKYS